jgi:hypothetical protein
MFHYAYSILSVSLSTDGDSDVVDISAAVSLVFVCQQLSDAHFLERLLKEQQQSSITMVLTVRRLAVSIFFQFPFSSFYYPALTPLLQHLTLVICPCIIVEYKNSTLLSEL